MVLFFIFSVFALYHRQLSKFRLPKYQFHIWVTEICYGPINGSINYAIFLPSRNSDNLLLNSVTGHASQIRSVPTRAVRPKGVALLGNMLTTY